MTVPEGIPGRIDHTVLRPDAAFGDIRRYCEEAMEYGFHSICVNPCRMALTYSILGRGAPKVCSVAGFPLGSGPATPREAGIAAEQGAGEIDAVLPVGLLRDGDAAGVLGLLKDVVSAAGVPVKIILETCLLTLEEKLLACRLAVDAGAFCVKTSTGFGAGGATVEDVTLIRRTVGPGIQVKASGGIRTPETLRAMLDAGATIIGTSSGVEILKKMRRPEG